MHVHTHVCTHNTHANTRIHTHKSTKLHCQHEMTLLQNYFHKPMPVAACVECEFVYIARKKSCSCSAIYQVYYAHIKIAEVSNKS